MTLEEFFSDAPRAALGLSGGVDSSYLLYAAKKYGAADVRPFFVKTQFQPEFELRDAQRVCEMLDTKLEIIQLDVLAFPEVVSNPSDRCYYCKRRIFSAVAEAARREGCSLLIDGTNASDEVSDRPGMRALQELSVRSPLRECNLTKAEIRALAREAGLFVWDKPAYACLATRLPAGETITRDALEKVETAENALYDLGFRDLRVRVFGGAARVQLREEQMPAALEQREKILSGLKPLFGAVMLDLEAR
ncbi:MAG: ATP-dependent sacrificial sulfur transferase LarE [Oscillospiraceae bacterium]|nr:ATP-dependent sacrificial sulfur transferase LarE [Oscillospiraceae bacterium]